MSGFGSKATVGFIEQVRVGNNGGSYHLALGEVLLLQSVALTKTHTLGGLHLALARDPLSRQVWMVVSSEPTTLQTFREYGERFQIEEELLDEKSNGFQLERSEIRSAPALSRLCPVMAVAKKAAHRSRTASGHSGSTSLGGCSLAAGQQLSEKELELAQGSAASRLAALPHGFLAGRG